MVGVNFREYRIFTRLTNLKLFAPIFRSFQSLNDDSCFKESGLVIKQQLILYFSFHYK